MAGHFVSPELVQKKTTNRKGLYRAHPNDEMFRDVGIGGADGMILEDPIYFLCTCLTTVICSMPHASLPSVHSLTPRCSSLPLKPLSDRPHLIHFCHGFLKFFNGMSRLPFAARATIFGGTIAYLRQKATSGKCLHWTETNNKTFGNVWMGDGSGNAIVWEDWIPAQLLSQVLKVRIASMLEANRKPILQPIR